MPNWTNCKSDLQFVQSPIFNLENYMITKTTTLYLLLLCSALPMMASKPAASAAASASASASPCDEETALKKALTSVTTLKYAYGGNGEDASNLLDVSELFQEVEEKEEAIVTAHVKAAQFPENKKLQEAVRKASREHTTLGEEVGRARLPMNCCNPLSATNTVARLLLKNRLLTLQVKKLQQESQPGSQ